MGVLLPDPLEFFMSSLPTCPQPGSALWEKGLIKQTIEKQEVMDGAGRGKEELSRTPWGGGWLGFILLREAEGQTWD